MSAYAAGAGAGSFARSRGVMAEIEGWLDGPAAGLEHGELEEQLQVRVRELGRRLLQDHLDVREAREKRLAQVTGPDGITRTRAERARLRQLVTVFGKVTAGRIAYRRPGAPDVHVADAALNLPREIHSHGLRKLAAAEAARGSYADAAAAITRATGVRLGKRQVQELAARAAADFESFYAGRPAPAGGDGQVVVLQADAKGIRVLPGSLRPAAARAAAAAVPKQAGRLSQGEVRTRKRMAGAGAVYDLVPAPRTAADIIALPGEELPARPEAAKAPGILNKYLTATIAQDTSAVIAGIFAEASRRDPARERTWIALADGNKDQLAHFAAQAAGHGKELPVLLDLIHVSEYLWDAAWSFFPRDSPHAGPWVRQHTRAILEGHAAGVAAAIAGQSAATSGLSASKRDNARRTIRYLTKHAPYLDYPRFLANGWPVSTGIIEGACRYLIKDRMDITGARWSTPGAEAILKLRALHANGDFDDYWTWHLQQEHHRNHPALTLAA